MAAEYRSAVNMATLICFIAAVQYFGMQREVGIDAGTDSIITFPTELRYIDWLLTTPLLVAMVPTLLNPGARFVNPPGHLRRHYDHHRLSGEIATSSKRHPVCSIMFEFRHWHGCLLSSICLLASIKTSIKRPVLSDGYALCACSLPSVGRFIGYVVALSFGTLELQRCAN
ncbi:MAG: bacteriorhodopsin [Candidatus Competibacteraceae bacterium]